jgi:hypothetical protein
MLARLILFLLALAFAAPAATAACHARDAEHHAAAPSHHGSAPAERQDDAVASTACIGCVPPSNWTPGRLSAGVLAPVDPVAGRIAALSIGRGAPPALPPPRIG